MARSTSDIKFMRTRRDTPTEGAMGIQKSVSDWHVSIPGMGGTAPWPGLACETPLEGALQQENYTSMEARIFAGEAVHAECRQLADNWLNDVAGSTGPGVFSISGSAPQGVAGAAGADRVGDDGKDVPTPRRRTHAKSAKAGTRKQPGPKPGKG